MTDRSQWKPLGPAFKVAVRAYEVRTAPDANDSHRAKIELLMSKAGLKIPVGQSEITT
jgi:hypothetical protein